MTTDTTQNETLIRELVERWADAVRRRDLAAILLHHSMDIVMYDVPPPLQSKGIDAYRRTWDLFFSWTRDPVVFDIIELHVVAGDDVGFAYALMRCAGREPDRRDIELMFRLTVGVQKIAGRWIVVHEHHSIPAES